MQYAINPLPLPPGKANRYTLQLLHPAAAASFQYLHLTNGVEFLQWTRFHNGFTETWMWWTTTMANFNYNACVCMFAWGWSVVFVIRACVCRERITG